MAFFTDMKRSLTEAGKQVAQKTKEVSGTVQLKTQISREKEAVNRQYAQIGKKVFEAANTADEEAYSAEFALIRESLKTIDELQDKLSTLEGFIHCPECGARIEKTAAFCSKCGAKIAEVMPVMLLSTLSILLKQLRQPKTKHPMIPAPAKRFRMRNSKTDPPRLRQM